tara:strand:- start:1522 stop:2952 length:1431 start_codon:yes stop_codon:yes gene_type:complete
MREKQTKVVATISDRNCSVPLLKKLYKAGMDVVRLNTAHQDLKGTLKVVENVRKVADDIAILVDIKGPEIRTSETSGDLLFRKNAVVQIKSGSLPTTDSTIYVSYSKFVKEVPNHSTIAIDDGELTLKVIKKSKTTLTCKVSHKGVVGSRKTVNVPNVILNLPTLSKKDKLFIAFAIRHKIDFLAQSFVRSKKDIQMVKNILKKRSSKIKIIAKIENNQGVQNIDEILEVAHGIMVARGDLGVELLPEVVPLIQKQIITKCIKSAKPVIIATQMLQSMINHPRPTRAEVSDVANAILDGTDAIMLSGETAKGIYPVEAVEVMSRVAHRVEASKPNFKYAAMKQASEDLRTRLGKAALAISADTNINAMVVPSNTGRTARYISSFRGKIRIYAPAFNESVMRQLQLSYGVHPTLIKKVVSTDTLLHKSMAPLVASKKLKGSDVVVIVVATPAKFQHASNFMEINTVRNCLKNRSKTY